MNIWDIKNSNSEVKWEKKTEQFNVRTVYSLKIIKI